MNWYKTSSRNVKFPVSDNVTRNIENMFKKIILTEEEKQKLFYYIYDMTWEDMVEQTTIHFVDLDPTKFKHRASD